MTEAFPELGGQRFHMLDEVLRTGVPVEIPRRSVGLRDLSGDDFVLHYVVAPLGAAAPYEGVVMTAVSTSPARRSPSRPPSGPAAGAAPTGPSRSGTPTPRCRHSPAALVPVLADVVAVFSPARAFPAGPRNRPAAVSVARAAQGPAHRRRRTPRRAEPSPWEPALAPAKPRAHRRRRGPAPSNTPTPRRLADRAGARNLAVVPLSSPASWPARWCCSLAGDRPRTAQEDVPFLELSRGPGRCGGRPRAHREHQRQIARPAAAPCSPRRPRRGPGCGSPPYVAGTADVEVGGDWWDVQLGRRAVGVGVGDVSGGAYPRPS